MVLCFPWQNRRWKAIMHSFRPDLQDWFHQTQWTSLDNYAAFLTSGFQKGYCLFPIWMESAGWVAGGTVLSCPAARQGREVPWFPCPPGRSSLAGLTHHLPQLVSGAAPHLPGQTRPPECRVWGEYRGEKEAGVVLVFVYSDFMALK